MTVDNRYNYFVAVTTFKALIGLVPNTISTPGYLVHIPYLILNQKLTILTGHSVILGPQYGIACLIILNNLILYLHLNTVVNHILHLCNLMLIC